MASKTYAQAIAALKKSPQDYAATVAGQIERIDDSKVVIVKKLVDMKGLEADSALDDAAIALDGVTIAAAGTHDIAPGQTYTIPEGYYKGDVNIKAGTTGGDLKYQEKTATPTKAQQVITPDTGFNGLNKVTVEAIPAAYQDVTAVTATADKVLVGSKFVDSDGQVVDGSMANQGSKSKVLDATAADGEYTNTQFTIAKGYHDGTGKVSIVFEADKTVTPSESVQNILATSGKVLGKVIVSAIDKPTYLTSWTTDATAGAGDMLVGKTAYIKGSKVTGTMVDNSATWDGSDATPIEHVLDTTAENSHITVPAGYHNGKGVVKVVTQTKSVSAEMIAGHQAIDVVADEGKVLSKVTIAALDAKYQDVSAVTAVAGDVLTGKKIVSATGAVIIGTMANLGALDNTLDVLGSGASGVKVNHGAGYTTGGACKVTGDLYSLLAAI